MDLWLMRITVFSARASRQVGVLDGGWMNRGAKREDKCLYIRALDRQHLGRSLPRILFCVVELKGT